MSDPRCLSPFQSPFVEDKGCQHGSFGIADAPDQQVSICHLGNNLRVDEGAHLDPPDPGPSEKLEELKLL